MGRHAARITHDEVCRMVKAVKSLGLPISRVSFDGNKLDVIIGEVGEGFEPPVDKPKEVERL